MARASVRPHGSSPTTPISNWFGKAAFAIYQYSGQSADSRQRKCPKLNSLFSAGNEIQRLGFSEKESLFLRIPVKNLWRKVIHHPPTVG
jgi:hypothetical protein